MYSSPINRETVQNIIRETTASSKKALTKIQCCKHDNPMISHNRVIDPDQSVSWNRAEIKRLNEDITKKRSRIIATYTSQINQGAAKIAQAMMDYIHDEYGFGETFAKIIYQKAYADAHTFGYDATLNRIDEYADFAQQILDASE